MMKKYLVLLILIFLQCFMVVSNNPVIVKRSVADEETTTSISSKDDYWHENDKEFLCLKSPQDTWSPIKEAKNTTQFKFAEGLIGSRQLCCAEIHLSKMEYQLLRYDGYSIKGTYNEAVEKLEEASETKEKPEAFCIRDGYDSITCCCTKSLCNNVGFVLYNLNELHLQVFGTPPFMVIEFVALALSIFLIILTLAIIYTIAHYTCLQKFTSKKRVELPAMKNIDLRGIIIQPYISSEEAEAIIDQIKTARSTRSFKESTMKKINFRSVSTFSTVNELTIREPAPTEFPPLISKNPCMEMLSHMIRNGPKEIKFDPNSLILCYEKALKVLKSEPVLQEATLPVTVYGDIHGQYSDLIRWFHINGWPPTTRCIFMGDYVDRGRHSLEVITLLLCLKAVMPNDVYLNRGNHEDAAVSRNYSFYHEVINRLPANSNLNQNVFDKLVECFSWMPLATRLNNKILLLHGGLSPRLLSWDSIAKIKRPLMNLVPRTLACDLTWSDPDKESDDYIINYKREKKNGIGFIFGYKQVDVVCKDLQVKLILRGHQAPMNGYEFFGPKMCTLFSAPGYRGIAEQANFGATMHIDVNGNMDITRIGITRGVRKERRRQKLDKGEGYLDWSEIKDKPMDDDDERSC